ncbi:hypothetical protein A9Q81_04920 [Gammaproteobacteria bacterium 42_54_T18]|nr:hypothetical protein A9Q81_04920 [Gammaproteobacteria bacterium 42_54_T18]
MVIGALSLEDRNGGLSYHLSTTVVVILLFNNGIKGNGIKNGVHKKRESSKGTHGTAADWYFSGDYVVFDDEFCL